MPSYRKIKEGLTPLGNHPRLPPLGSGVLPILKGTQSRNQRSNLLLQLLNWTLSLIKNLEMNLRIKLRFINKNASIVFRKLYPNKSCQLVNKQRRTGVKPSARVSFNLQSNLLVN